MRHLGLLLPAWVLLAAAGCAGNKSAVKAEGDDAAEYAKTTKQQVKQCVQVGRENPRTVGAEAEALLERLQVHTSRPVGEHKATYEQLTQKCKDLVDAAKKSPGSSEVKKLLDDLNALADKLPG